MNTSSATPAVLILWPGASAGKNHRNLVALEEALAPFPVLCREFPAQQAGGKGRDKPAVAVASIRDEIAAVCEERSIEANQVAIGGRSYGGRMCSLAVSQGQEVAALVLLSYPLHRPGKPENLRAEHFPKITVPTLFVSGKRDPFGTPREFEREEAAIIGPVTHAMVPGRHDPGPTDEVADAVKSFLVGLGASL